MNTPRFDSWQGKEVFLLVKMYRLTLRWNQPSIQWVMEALSPGVKWLGREADHLHLILKLKTSEAIPLLPPCAFVSYTGTASVTTIYFSKHFYLVNFHALISLFQISTNKCTHVNTTLLTLYHSDMHQPSKSHPQGVRLIHFKSKVNRKSDQ
jgi:hypothetical protein